MVLFITMQIAEKKIKLPCCCVIIQFNWLHCVYSSEIFAFILFINIEVVNRLFGQMCNYWWETTFRTLFPFPNLSHAHSSLRLFESIKYFLSDYWMQLQFINRKHTLRYNWKKSYLVRNSKLYYWRKKIDCLPKYCRIEYKIQILPISDIANEIFSPIIANQYGCSFNSYVHFKIVKWLLLENHY